MPKVTREEKVDIKIISKTGGNATRQYWDDGTTTISNLYEIIAAGALQRIAQSLESIDITLQRLEGKTEKQLGTFELQKQVTKLSMRLKKAGLDSNPNSDNRGRKRV